MKSLLTIGLPCLLVLGLILTAIYWPRSESTDQKSAGEWTCSMHPQVRRPAPGRCPICGMDLVPVTQLSTEQARLEQRAGIETEPVTHRELFKELRTVGKIDYSERQMSFITARLAGRVERVYADFTGIQVKKGDHLVDIFSSELMITVQSLLDAKQNGNQNVLDIARDRLRIWSISPEQIAEIEKSGKARINLTIHAPIGGTVIEKSVREGQYVKEGDMLYRIADLDPIWLYLDIYEYDLGWVRLGQKVEVAVEAYSGEAFPGTITFLDPFLDDKSRTVKARVNLPNPQKKLRPAMYASASIRVKLRADGTPEPTGLEGKYLCPMHPEVVKEKPGKCSICEMPLEKVPDASALKAAAQKGESHEGHVHDHGPDLAKKETGKVLAIRASAILDTGRRKITYRKAKEGAYELVDLQLGPRADGKDDTGQRTSYYPVLSGLQAGDWVVVRGGFLLDSQRQIEGMPSLLYPQGQGPATLHAGHGDMPAPKKSSPTEVHKH